MEKQPIITLKSRSNFRDCIQWNEDGQIAICLTKQVHIITPILIDLSSKEDNYKHTGFNLPEFKPPEVKGDRALKTDDLETSYFQEEGFRCAKWSQTGISRTQSCFLVVVTTKHRVLLYQSAIRDPINSDWQLFANITDAIKDNAIPHDYPTKVNPHHTLYASWSKNIVPDRLATKLSLLALTNKSGDVCIWTVDSKSTNYATTVTPHTSFVNLVEWTNWKKGKDDDTQIAYFASASTNGTVAISSVVVKTKVENHTASIQDIKAQTLYTWFADNPSVPTLLKIHDDFKNDTPYVRIAVSKGVTIWFLCLSLNENAMDVDVDWIPHDLKYSALGLAAGTWINDFNFRCYTVEGEGIQLYLSASGELSLDVDMHVTLNNRLMQKYKQQWINEQEEVDEDDVVGSSDALPYIWGAGDSVNHLFTAMDFTMRPTVDIHYVQEHIEETNLAFILQKPRGVGSASLIEEVETYVKNPNFLFVKPVRGLLREILAYLIEDDNLTPLENWFNKLKEYTDSAAVFDNSDLTTTLYCEPSMIASRIINNANLEMKNYKLLMFEDELEIIFNHAKQKTWENYLKSLFQFVSQFPDEKFTQFSEQDRMVLLLLADLALIKNSKSLNQFTLEFYMKLQDKFSDLNLYEEIAYLSNPEGPFHTKAREKCPVCDETVQSIDDGTIAQCAAGHFWELCSITRRVLFSPYTRKCSCCGAKSLQVTGDGSLTDMILSHCVRCIYCGAGLLSS